MKAQKKNEEIKKALEKNTINEKNKIITYTQKQQIIEQKKEEIELLKSEEIRNKSQMMRMREEKIQATLKHNKEIVNNRAEQILEKIHHNDIKVKYLSEVKEREAMQAMEEHSLNRFEKSQNIKRISHIQEYHRHQLQEQIEEKFQRIDEFKRQKSLISIQKREMANEIEKKKQEYSNKFEKLFKKKNIDVRIYVIYINCNYMFIFIIINTKQFVPLYFNVKQFVKLIVKPLNKT